MIELDLLQYIPALMVYLCVDKRELRKCKGGKIQKHKTHKTIMCH